MGTHSRYVPPQGNEPTGRPDLDAEPVIPRPLPQQERRASRAALAVMVLALAIIVLVVLL